jgi:hypothetical protein
MNKEEDVLLGQVEATVNGLIVKRKLRWMSDTEEFKEGLLVGLELAGIYGKQISEIYKTEEPNMLTDDSTNNDVVHEPSEADTPTDTPTED